MKRIILAAVLAAMGAATVLAANADKFESVALGFTIVKPSAWRFATDGPGVTDRKRAELSEAEFQALVEKYADAPLVAMTKHPEPYEDLNPSLRVNVRPIGNLRGVAPTQALQPVIQQLSQRYEDFDVEDGPTATTLGGHEAGYVRLRYAAQLPDGRDVPVASELWIVPGGDLVFLIGAGTRLDETTGSRKEIAAILATVRIVD